MGCSGSKNLTPESRYELAVWYQENGEVELAEEHFEDIIDKFRASNGPYGEMTLKCLGNLAMIKMTKHEYNSAEKFLMELLVGKNKTVGAAHADTMFYVGVLGRCLEGQGRSRDDIKLALKDAGYDMEMLENHAHMHDAEKMADNSIKLQEQCSHSVRRHNAGGGHRVDVPIVAIGYEGSLLPRDFVQPPGRNMHDNDPRQVATSSQHIRPPATTSAAALNGATASSTTVAVLKQEVKEGDTSVTQYR